MTTPSVRRPGPASSRTTPPEGAAAPVATGPDPRHTTERMMDFQGCFGCGADAADGLRVAHRDVTGHEVRTEFTVREAHQGAPGLAHGGLLATAMDETLGSVAWHLGKRCVTGRLETDYLAPVPVGGVLHLRGWCTGVHGRKVYVEGEGRIGGPDGPVAIRAAGLFVEVPEEHFTRDRTAEARPAAAGAEG
ncbi:PaaI family thioesterase [Actinomadura parmotrematis]|uniref:Acyl-coenzyme A thioesterase THEM4 n=1 Tax=Actinomadura parmotrematis TaxID=2864039 RepID=A0ABS7FSY7_9ACTN|nr:PaaI family thioesterase [Actinomadura parmotrematis]MBW8483075.1 PaaI family thioesterase [Actinomadura parmotrematis]